MLRLLVLPHFDYEGEQQQSSNYSRKMKSSVRTKIVAKGDTWYTMTAALTERKLRTAACTNNTDTLKRLCANGVNVNCSDGQQRTALHFGASKGKKHALKKYDQLCNFTKFL